MRTLSVRTTATYAVRMTKSVVLTEFYSAKLVSDVKIQGKFDYGNQ